MAEKKMTQKRALEIAAELMFEEINHTEEDDVAAELTEAHEVITKMLEKKNVARPHKVDALTAAFREMVLSVLGAAKGPLTNKDIQELLQTKVDAGELELAPTTNGEHTTKVTSQRVANNMKVLEKQNAVTRIRGEKASDKDSFVLA